MLKQDLNWISTRISLLPTCHHDLVYPCLPNDVAIGFLDLPDSVPNPFVMEDEDYLATCTCIFYFTGNGF